MFSFMNDYSEGAHPKILERLLETNLTQQPGYGNDPYCDSAKAKIRAACACPDAEIFFLVGGTQTNATVIAGLLSDYEGVISAATGHVNVHEAGAIEYTGHKVLTLPGHDGKLDPDELAAYLARFYADGSHEHMVFPGMVYISHPTEYGTLYAKAELARLSAICREYALPLYLDGARLGYGLASYQTDIALPDIARACDAFYIGGTKVGALCGEAVVFPHGAPKHFLTTTKQHGAMLAKGRLLGLQFDALFTNGLYEQISRHAIDQAERLKQVFRRHGYDFFLESPTNQQFILLDNEKLEELQSKVVFEPWEPVDENRTAVRFATSWATPDEAIDALDGLL